MISNANAGREVAQVGDHGRQDCQQYAQVRNQAEESADCTRGNRSTGRPIMPNRRDAADAEKHSDDEVTHNERADHARDQAQHYVGRVAVLHAEQHHRLRAHVVLPAQHEEHQERNKCEGQHQLGNGVGVLADHVRPIARLLHGQGFAVLGAFGHYRLGGLLNLLSLLAELRSQGLNPGLVLGHLVHEIQRSAVGDVAGQAQVLPPAITTATSEPNDSRYVEPDYAGRRSGARTKASRMEIRTTTRISLAT